MRGEITAFYCYQMLMKRKKVLDNTLQANYKYGSCLNSSNGIDPQLMVFLESNFIQKGI